MFKSFFQHGHWKLQPTGWSQSPGGYFWLCPLILSHTCCRTYCFPTSLLSPSEETDISKPYLTWLDVMVSSCPAAPLCLSCWSTTEIRLVQITWLSAVKTAPARLLSSVSVPWDWKLHPESAIQPCSITFGLDEHCVVFPPSIWNYRPTECYHMVSNETANYINRFSIHNPLLLHQSNVLTPYRLRLQTIPVRAATNNYFDNQSPYCSKYMGLSYNQGLNIYVNNIYSQQWVAPNMRKTSVFF